MARDVKWVDGLPVCQRPEPEQEECDDCYGLGFLYIVDGADTPVCMGAVRDDRALLVAISEAVYGTNFDQPYDEPRALAGLVDAVRAGWAEKERLRGELETAQRERDEARSARIQAEADAEQGLSHSKYDDEFCAEIVAMRAERDALRDEVKRLSVHLGVATGLVVDRSHCAWLSDADAAEWDERADAFLAGAKTATGCHCDGGCGGGVQLRKVVEDGRKEWQDTADEREAACAYWHEAGRWCSKCGTTPKASTSSLADLRNLVGKNNEVQK